MITINISTDEIEAARNVVSSADPSETNASHGVALVVHDGMRRWTAWGDDVLASTTTFPAPGTTDGQVLVSRRLVEFGAHLAEEGHDLVLTFDGEHTSIGDDTAALSFGCPSPRPVPDAAEPLSGAACAGTEARDLYNLFSMGCKLPAGVDLRYTPEPLFEVTIRDQSLIVSVDWSDAGAPATRLEITANTDGRALTAVSPRLATHVVGHTDPTETVVLSIPADAPWVQFETATWTARVRVATLDEDQTDKENSYRQDSLPFEGVIECHGGLRPDPLEGASLTDVRAYAMDPDADVRMLAAASRWNCDLRVQSQLATDVDERIVLALLDHIDPGMETCLAIIDGPHVAARLQLAGRNLVTSPLERLANDPDPLTAETAQRALARRFDTAAELAGTK